VISAFFISACARFFASLLLYFFTSVWLTARKVGGENSSPHFMNNPS
jgi:hypothetical protein